MTSRPRTIDLVFVIGLAALTHFGYFALSDDYYFPDSATYLAPARGMLHGWGFATDPETVETLRTPGYPLLLLPFLAVTSSPVPVIVFHHLITALLAGCIYLLMMRRIGDRFAAIAAAVIFALDAPTIHHANKVLTEAPFTVLLFLAFVLVERRRAGILLGLLMGALTLFRPVAIAYFVVVALFFLWQRVPKKQIALFVLASLALPLAWAARNYHHTDALTVASIGGSNVLMYRAAGALAIEDDDVFAKDLAFHQAELQRAVDREIVSEEEVRSVAEVDHAVRAEYYSADGRAIIRDHIPAFIELTLRGLLVNLFESDWEAVMVVSNLHNSIVQIAIDAFTVGVVLLGIVGLVALWRTDRALTILLAATIVYFLGISAGGESEARFRVPVMPQLAMAAGVGLRRAFREPQ